MLIPRGNEKCQANVPTFRPAEPRWPPKGPTREQCFLRGVSSLHKASVQTDPESPGRQQSETSQSNDLANEIIVVPDDSSEDEMEVIEETPDNPRYYNIVVPFRERSCPRCLRAGRNLVFMALNDQIKHAEEEHPASEIVFECTNCERLFPKKHSAVCHVPKCTGGRARPA
ncbi:hypothetical protein JTB14_015043 [Gonioctena quinquepunctata]|nr:hypothetical protein JTB14_015043 [Gonioctena quinquepunctata]